MLSLFPSLLTYQLVVPFVLRIALAVSLLSCCYKKVKSDQCSFFNCWGSISDNRLKAAVIFHFMVSIFLILGLFTQAAAILAMVGIAAKELVLKQRGEKCADKATLVLLIAVCFSLLILGPGIFSIDLPL